MNKAEAQANAALIVACKAADEELSRRERDGEVLNSRERLLSIQLRHAVALARPDAQLVELGPNILAELEAICPDESIPFQIAAVIEERNALLKACEAISPDALQQIRNAIDKAR